MADETKTTPDTTARSPLDVARASRRNRVGKAKPQGVDGVSGESPTPNPSDNADSEPAAQSQDTEGVQSDAQPQAQEKSNQPKNAQQRIRRLARQLAEEQERAEALKAELEALKSAGVGSNGHTPVPPQAIQQGQPAPPQAPAVDRAAIIEQVLKDMPEMPVDPEAQAQWQADLSYRISQEMVKVALRQVGDVVGPLVHKAVKEETEQTWAKFEPKLAALGTDRLEVEPVVKSILAREPSRSVSSAIWEALDVIGLDPLEALGEAARNESVEGEAPPPVAAPGKGTPSPQAGEDSPGAAWEAKWAAARESGDRREMERLLRQKVRRQRESAGRA